MSIYPFIYLSSKHVFICINLSIFLSINISNYLARFLMGIDLGDESRPIR